MIAKTIKYEDMMGNEVEGEFLFNLSKVEVLKWLTSPGEYTLDQVMNKLYTEKNLSKIMDIFEDVIKRSYGTISVDGKSFEKSEVATKKFMESEAYSELFMELMTDTNKAAEFITGILPRSLADEVKKELEKLPD